MKKKKPLSKKEKSKRTYTYTRRDIKKKLTPLQFEWKSRFNGLSDLVSQIEDDSNRDLASLETSLSDMSKPRREVEQQAADVVEVMIGQLDDLESEIECLRMTLAALSREVKWKLLH